MPVIDSSTRHAMHGAIFESFVSPSAGSNQLCAWRTTVSAGQPGSEHRVDHEEVFLVLSGRLQFTLDGSSTEESAGAVVFAPAGTSVRVDNPGTEPAQMWVTAPVGLTATTATGQRISPPWTL